MNTFFLSKEYWPFRDIVNSHQVAEVVEDMEVEDEVVGVREVMGEVDTGEAAVADGREGENCKYRINENFLNWKIILEEEAMTVAEVVEDMVVAGVTIGEVEEEVEVAAHKVQRTGANQLPGGAPDSLLFLDSCCC